MTTQVSTSVYLITVLRRHKIISFTRRRLAWWWEESSGGVRGETRDHPRVAEEEYGVVISQHYGLIQSRLRVQANPLCQQNVNNLPLALLSQHCL